MNHSFQEHKQIWRGAWILTFSAILIKVLSAVYRIPYQNLAGDVGFYIYQQVYPIYSAAFVLSIYGFPVVISQMIAGEKSEDKRQGIVSITLIVLSLAGLLLFAAFYLGASGIAKVMGDGGLALPIKASAFSFLMMPLLSTFRGYFQANQWMTPTAVSQIAEQSVRVFGILGLTLFLLANGYNVYETGAAAALSSVMGAMTAVLVLLFFLRGKASLLLKNTKYVRRMLKPVSYRIFKHGFLICISSLFIVFLQFIDAVTILNSLIRSGVEDEQAKILKGVYDRSHPFLQLGATLAVSLSLTTVPLITQAMKNRKQKDIMKFITLSYKLCIAVGSAASVGLALIIVPANMMLYKSAEGSLALAISGSAIFFYSIVLTSAAVLQGLGDFWSPAVYIALGCIAKILLNPLLTHFFHINGAAVATVCSVSITGIFLTRHVAIRSDTKLNKLFIDRSLLIALVGMATSILVLHYTLEMVPLMQSDSRLIASFETITSVLIGAVTYGFILLKFGYFSNENLSILPFGDKLQLFLGKRT